MKVPTFCQRIDAIRLKEKEMDGFIILLLYTNQIRMRTKISLDTKGRNWFRGKWCQK